MSDPQREVSTQLHGLGRALDITSRNVIAGFNPLVIGIGLEDDPHVTLPPCSNLSMKFFEAKGENKLLAEIGLQPVDTVPLRTGQLSLFRVRNCKNACTPRLYFFGSFMSRAMGCSCSLKCDGASKRPTALESQGLFAFYICPRPVVLVSVVDGEFGTIFPMDLIGPVGPRSFSLALRSAAAGVSLIERSRCIALASVPPEQAPVAYALGKNHKNNSVDWRQIPFSTTKSAAFGLPVPQFSTRVREMQVAFVRKVGTHTLFVCEVVEDLRYSTGPQLCIVHGFYQSWKNKQQAALRIHSAVEGGMRGDK